MLAGLCSTALAHGEPSPKYIRYVADRIPKLFETTSDLDADLVEECTTYLTLMKRSFDCLSQIEDLRYGRLPRG